MWHKIALLAGLVLSLAVQSHAETATASWGAVTTRVSGDPVVVDGYHLYWGHQPGNYSNDLDVGNVLAYGPITVTGETYFAVKAYIDTSFKEAGCSADLQNILFGWGKGRADLLCTGYVVDYPDAPISGPDVAVSNDAGVLNGSYKYVVTYMSASAQSKPSAGSVTVSPVNEQVELTNILTGPEGTTARILYRTVAGGSIYYYLDTIGDNTTTVYTDVTADSGLTLTSIPPWTVGEYCVFKSLTCIEKDVPVRIYSAFSNEALKSDTALSPVRNTTCKMISINITKDASGWPVSLPENKCRSVAAE